MEADTQREMTREYTRFFDSSVMLYLEAQERIRPAACQSDNDYQTWKTYNHAVFTAINPVPSSVHATTQNQDAGYGRDPAPVIDDPKLRWNIIRTNDLHPLTTEEEVRMHMLRFNATP
jgi:hypothetical protein